MREFLIPLYTEHLEEASFLYGLCRSRRRDDEWPWTDVADTEARLEAHLDALVLGGDLALETGLARLPDADAGEWFALAAVVARRALAPQMAHLLRLVPLDQPGHLQALADALCQEVPAAWQASLVQSLQAGAEAHPVLWSLAWRRRWLPADQVVALARRVPLAARPWCQGAWPLLAAPGAAGLLAESPLPPADDMPWAPAIGPDAASAHLAAQRGHLLPTDAPLATACVGGAEAAQALVRRWLAAGPTAPDAVATCVAVGLCGELSAVRPLLSALADGGLAPHAAQALYLITGAPLFEQVFVPDEDDDEAEARPARPLQAGGALPKPGDGRTRGEMKRLLSQDPARWQAWLSAHSGQFQAGRRHRLGQPWQAQVLLDALQSADYPKALRPLLPLELWWRHGIDLPFDTDLRVALQRQLFSQATAAVAAERSPAGAWLLQGPSGALALQAEPSGGR
ncbi:MAG: hypothetical protein RI907_3496 [Pseudomonadota bacterium]|jgi:hypothetical protein